MNKQTTTLILCLLTSAIPTLNSLAETIPHASLEYNQRFVEHLPTQAPKPGETIYVSPTVSSDGNGSLKSPYASLELARNAIRELKQDKGLPKGGVEVILLSGIHHRETVFKLDAIDSGTKISPIVYRGQTQEETTITSGIELDLSSLSIVSAQPTLKRLHPLAQGQVVSVNVPKSISANFPGDGDYGMISMNGHLLSLAQWPNRGYYHIDKVIEKGPTTRWLKPNEKPHPYSKENPTGGKLTFREELSPLLEAEYERSGDMQAQGYFHNDWFFQAEQVGGVSDNVLQLLRYTRYGIEAKIKSIPRRIRLVNVLAELDEPGEWYFDKKDQKIYVWPIPGFEKNTSTIVVLPNKNLTPNNDFTGYSTIPVRSNPGESLFELEHTSHVSIQNLTFENSGSQAVRIEGGNNNLIASCTVKNGINRGVAIEGGTRNGITGCDFHNFERAFCISGGDFAKLVRCYNFATNNDIHSCRKRGYGMINLDGVGLYFAHNRLHDMNGAVIFNTVDLLMEYNEFYNVGYEMGDFNVAYCGAVWYTMNNVVRFNFVHHLLEPGGHPVMGFRNDDGGAGLQMFGNVFYRSGRGAGQFAGPLNSFENNITMISNKMWWSNKCATTPDAIEARWKDLEKFGRDLPHGDKGDNIYIMEQFMGKEGWKKSPWIDEFPKLAEMLELNPFAQTFGRVDKNYIYKIKEPFHIHGAGGDVEGMESKEVGEYADLPKSGYFVYPEPINLDAFEDIKSLDFRFKTSFESMDGWTEIPFENIGLIQDQFRPNAPCKKEYRSETYQQFLNDEGGRYDAESVNARYPTPAYLK